MGVGAGDTKRTDTGVPRLALAWPGRGFGDHLQSQAIPFDPRVGRVEVHLGHQGLLLQAQQDLGQPGHPGDRFEMPHVGLDRAHQQRCIHGPLLAQYRMQGVQFDRVTQRGAGAMGLDIVDLAALEPGLAERQPDHLFLGVDVGHGDAAAGAVVVDRTTLDHGQHRVLVAYRIAQPLERKDHAAFGAPVAIGRRVEGLAAAIGGHGPQLADQDETVGRQDQVDPTGQRQLALAAAQAVAGLVQGHQG